MSRDDLPFDPDVLDEDRPSPSQRDLAIATLSSTSWPDWWRRRRAVLALIAVGGGLGSLVRYGVAQWIGVDDGTFPWATFVVNLCGCVLVGALMVAFVEVRPSSRYGRPFLVIGVIGGLTTYSTLMGELRALAAADRWTVLVTYLGASLVLGVVGVVAGVLAARSLAGLPLLGPPASPAAAAPEDGAGR